ncbi:hypothetical protein HPP92_029142, partial [Vanilla planifolia]
PSSTYPHRPRHSQALSARPFPSLSVSNPRYQNTSSRHYMYASLPNSQPPRRSHSIRNLPPSLSSRATSSSSSDHKESSVKEVEEIQRWRWDEEGGENRWKADLHFWLPAVC